MIKRLSSLIIALLFILPLFVTSAEAVEFAQNPFEIYDYQRENALNNSVSTKTSGTKTLRQLSAFSSPIVTESDEKEYIVKFKDECSFSKIYDIVKKYNFNLLADSEFKLFSLNIKKYDEFIDKFGYAVKYIEEEQKREVSAKTNEPRLPETWGYEDMGIYKAWNYTSGKKSIIVAVLDTGIERRHEDFENTTILAGYDMLTNNTVVSDLVGHGTMVSGLIGATANNGKGSAGVSPGVTILPIKVSNSREMANKDIIAGIYFAVDAGAKIINMSLGGETSSTAEEDAIKYALKNGCILVAAAGNIKSPEFDGYKSYPASYDGVISVASVNENGTISSTSQHNESVDVAAPGDNIYVMKYKDGVSGYDHDKGTSFSCAYVSGIAALAASYIDYPSKLGSKEFMSLIKDTGGEWNEYYGYGIINAVEILDLVNLPIVSGVTNGETYFESVIINFNRGIAVLDGCVITDGESVVENGSHTLVITGANNYKRTIDFSIDNKPLNYSYVELTDYAYLTFEGGNATLDGIPYAAGQHIAISGNHIFVLSGKYSNSISKRFTLSFDLPDVVGVSNGGIYNAAVYIRIIGIGNATIDGTSFSGETIVSSQGNHILEVSNNSGSKRKSYSFTIENSAISTYQSDLKNGVSIVDPDNGYIVRHSPNIKGIRVYDINSLEKFNRFVGIGTVNGYDFYGSFLLIYHDNKITKLVRSKMLSNPVDSEINFDESITACVLVGDDIYYLSSKTLKKYNLITNKKSTVMELSMSVDTAFLSADGNSIYLFNTDDEGKKLIIYDIPSITLDEATIPVTPIGKKIIYGNNMFAIGNTVIEEGSLYQVSTNSSDIPVYIADNLLFTSKYIINIQTNEYLAVFRDEVTQIFVGKNNKTYVFYYDGKIDVISNTSNPLTDFVPAKFAAADYTDIISAHFTKQSHYNSFGNVFSGRTITGFVTYGNWIYVICADMPVLYKLDSKTLVQVDEISLRHLPKKMIVSDNNIYISFKNSTYIYSAKVESGDFGDYISVGFVPQNLVVTDNKFVGVVETKVVIYDLLSKTFVNTGKVANGVFAANNTIYTSSGSTIYMYDLNTYDSKGSIPVSNAIISFIISGDYLFTSGGVYSLTTKKLIYNIGDVVLTNRGNTVFTESGVFDLSSGEYISSFMSKGLYHYLDEEFNYYVVSGSTITRIKSANGSDLTEMPEISDIKQDETYINGVDIKYTYGIGYIGTKKIESSIYFTDGGEQIFTLALSCGITMRILFYVVPACEGIEILGGDRRMNVNETISLHIKSFPEGTNSVEVIFETKDIDIINVDDNGIVTALKEGVATVKAQTLFGDYYDECKITVSKTLIKFNSSVTYKVDRNNRFILEVPAGTNVSDVTNSLEVEGEAEIFDIRGNKTTGVIGTGMSLVLKNRNGEEIDKLIFSVLGDINGDGYISAADLFCLVEILEGKSYEKSFRKAADINKDGKITNGDMTAIKDQLLYCSDNIKISAKPPITTETNINALVNTKIYDREKVIVTIQLDGAKGIYAASGRLFYNPEILEYNKTTEQSWDSFVYTGDNFISFLTYDLNKTGSTRNNKAIIVIEFTLKEGALGKQALFNLEDVITVTDGVSYTLERSQTLRNVMQRTDSNFNLKINNADNFTFSKDVYEYNITVKSNVSVLDIEKLYPQGANVIISDNIIPEGDYLEIRVIYIDPDNSRYIYSINVTREKEYDPDDNCYLKSLVVDGYDLLPLFDKNITGYTLTVPYEMDQLSLNFLPVSEVCLTEAVNPKLEVGTNTVKITCVAENGDIKIYSINVIREKNTNIVSEVSDNSSVISIRAKPGFYVISISVLLIVAGCVVFVMVKRRKSKTNDDIK